MENREMFEIMLKRIEELASENAKLKLRIKFNKKCEELNLQEKQESETVSNDELDELFNPDNYKF